MTILFFDTETTGLPIRENNQFYHYSQLNNYSTSRLVSLSYIITDDQNNTIKQFDKIIKPNEFIIPDEVIKIHKITNEKAHNEGVDIKIVLDEFYEDLKTVNMIVAHNIDFDKNIVLSECFRLGFDDLINELSNKEYKCTKSMGTKFLGYNPSLRDLYVNLTNDVSKNNYHNSLFDTMICKECFFILSTTV